MTTRETKMTTKAEDVDEDVTGEPVEDAEKTPGSEPEAVEEKAPEETPETPETPVEKSGRDTVAVRIPVGGILLVAAVVLVLIASVTTAVLQWREADRLGDAAHTEQLVRTRSAEFSQALLAYRYTELDGARERIGSLSSAEFGQSYQTAFDGLAEVIRKYEANAKATVRDVYVNEVDGQRARTLVVLDTEVSSTAGVRRVLGTKLMLELILEKGVWKVDSMATLAADDESLTKPDGTTEKPDAEPETKTP
ncbi:hypothetical protein GCM10010439_57420 [Actinocorallia aurantiaca]|uniref:Mce-associated membrane protein n=2 Tax=Actinocorallia aurantiaca TaxID=46204 RepID=A0ABN3ULC3_9ACTN